MWRVIIAASTLLTLAFGSLANAKCAVCVESVAITTDGAGTDLRFTARSMNGQAFPETGTAVVMQFDGNRSKCLRVSLVRTGVDGDQATYVGRFSFIYQGATVLAGRADVGGSIYEFSAPLDGQPGTIRLSSYQGAINGTGAPQIVTPVTITPDPSTIDPRTAEQQRAAVTVAAQQPDLQGTAARSVSAWSPLQDLTDGLTQNSVGVLGLIVVAVAIVSAYFDRKRSLARTTAS